MIKQALDYLIKKIEQEVEQIQINMAAECCADYSEYKKSCGEVKGLLTARMMCLDLQQKADEEGFDD